MSFKERAITFACAAEHLVGILALPDVPVRRGVLVVVGGPQYRVGSHRQFLLLSRQLAAAGFPVLRFDYRGMGDSAGDPRTFEAVDEDLRAAIDVFFREVPSLEEVVIWGLCDAVSAALIYAPGDRRISGLVLANPWVRTPEGWAKAMVRHYYGSRLLSGAFWRKLFSNKIDVLTSIRGLMGNLRLGAATKENSGRELAFPERMAIGLKKFPGHVLFLLSGRDLTAQEFEAMIKTSLNWQQALARPQIEWQRLDQATHTFSSQAWRDQIGRWTIDWVRSW